MREVDFEYLVDGQPLLLPDAGVVLKEQDVESKGSGFDEAGVYHRVVVRHALRSWGFSYGLLTGEEMAYLRSLFRGKTYVTLRVRGEDGMEEQVRCRPAAWEVTLENRAEDLYRDLKLELAEC